MNFLSFEFLIFSSEISTTSDWKNALIDPSFILFSMSGLAQYLTFFLFLFL